MGRPQHRFGKEFEAEAVRLVETSGRTQKEIAEDLGIGLSTLRRWLARRRERDLEAPPPGREEDVATELKRLRAARQGGAVLHAKMIRAAGRGSVPTSRMCRHIRQRGPVTRRYPHGADEALDGRSLPQPQPPHRSAEKGGSMSAADPCRRSCCCGERSPHGSMTP